jgi:hypothetical protein
MVANILAGLSVFKAMKFRKWSYWPLASLIFLFVVVFAWILFPDQIYHTKHDTGGNQQAAQETAQDISAEMIAHYTKMLAGFTAILSLVSICQIYFLIRADKNTMLAAVAAKKSAIAAEKSLLVANRPVIIITPLELREPEPGQIGSHIHFGIMNSGKGAAIVNKVSATVQTTPSGGNVLTLASKTQYATPNAGFVIEVGQSISGHHIESPLLGISELQQINSGKMMLEIIFEVMFRDIIDSHYTQTFPFVFGHTQGIFTRSSRLIPEKAPKST